MLLGAHMSVAGGLVTALERGSQVGCQTMQIFTKNNTQWQASALTQAIATQFKEEWKKTSIHSIFAHASYLINLGSPDKELYRKSTMALIDELQRCEKLGLSFLVLHPGAAMDRPVEEALDRIAKAIDFAFQQTAGFQVLLLLENTAGQGSSVGHTFEHLGTLIKSVHEKKRLGVCFDTCHAFAAGYDFRTKESYEKTFSHFDKVIGLPQLKAFHLNDSKKELHCRVDRHEHIGKGQLGLSAFRLLLNDTRFSHIPMVLETPKGKECLEDIENLKVLRSLIQGSK